MYQNSNQQNIYQQNEHQNPNPAQNIMPSVQMVQNPLPNQPFMQQYNFQLNAIETCQKTPLPASVSCNHCNQYITTNIQCKRGQGAYCCCLLMTLTVGCCILPLLLKKCKDKIHICPNCHKEIAVCEYKPCKKHSKRR
ncbi:hypothetical protein ABPG74_003888 [Tetrahymena malaccensis]